MASDQDAQLDAVLVGGREKTQIRVVDYDSEWVHAYERRRQLIEGALQSCALNVQHIGSTSVVGLAAKPIIDILVTVPDIDDEPAYLPLMESVGFVLRVREPGHRMFRTPDRDVHVHFYEPQDPAVADYLDLRDWLRVSQEDRDLYAETKRVLAERSWEDMNYYAEAKTDIISAILAHAREWRTRVDTVE
jgi:GrpB-like predicted nucleotidyltransferase (UPF0157 family)